MEKEKNPSELPKENRGYLCDKEKDDFFCYIVAKLKGIEKIIEFVVLIFAVNFAAELLQIILLLLK